MENILENVREKIEQASSLYYSLVLLVAPAGAGKTTIIRKIHQSTGDPLLNLNLEISQHLLDLTERQRALQVHILLEDILKEADNEVVLLDNIEILFEVALKQDPLRLLLGLSRNRTVVATWNGEIKDNSLTYAAPGHPEHKHYPVRDFLSVILANGSQG